MLSGNTVRAKALAQLFDAKNVVARMAGVGPVGVKMDGTRDVALEISCR